MLAGETRQHAWHSARESWANVRRAFGIVALAVATISPVAWSRQQAPRRVQKDQPAAKAAAVDSLGDPLPEGARLRLGTLRFRPPSSVAELALSPDEKTIVTAGASSSPGMRRPAKSCGGPIHVNPGPTSGSLPTECALGVLIRQLSVLHAGKAERGGDLGNLPRHPRSADGQIAEQEFQPDRASCSSDRRRAGWAEAGSGSRQRRCRLRSPGQCALRNRQRSRRPIRFRQERPADFRRPLQPRAFLAGRKVTGRRHERPPR